MKFNKYLFVIVISIIVLIIKIYQFGSRIKKEKNKTELNGIQHSNKFIFIKNVKDKCNNDDCHLSMNLVYYITNLIKKHGLKKTLQEMRSDKNAFTTSKGEYVWIHRCNKKKECFFIYHYHDKLDNKNMKNAQIGMNKTCSEENCPVGKIITDLTKFSDTYGEGFYEYKWFDPITNDIIIKRSFISKLEKIKTQFSDDDTIYIGSGATVETRTSKLDIILISIFFINIIIYIFFWKYLNIDYHFNSIISNIVFYCVILFNLFNLYNIKLESRNIKSVQEDYINTKNSAISLSGLGLAISFFLSKIFLNKNPIIIKNAIKMLSFAIISSLLSFIDITNEDTARNISRKNEIKKILLNNSVSYMILTLLYAYKTI